ncbi:unnamed protein product [Sphagnum balticum]
MEIHTKSQKRGRVRRPTASARGGALQQQSVPDVSVRNHQPPPVSSISGGFTFRKLSDIQEVPNWFANPLRAPPPLLIRRRCHFCASITAKWLSHTSEGECKSHHSSK